MPIEEPSTRMRLRRKLEELVGVEEADLLMDRPPGGWSALVTNETLDLKLGALEARMNTRFESIESRFEAIDHRFEGIDYRFEAIDHRFESIQSQFESSQSQMAAGFRSIEAQTKAAFDSVESTIDSRINKAFVTQTWRLGGFMLGLGAVIVAALSV